MRTEHSIPDGFVPGLGSHDFVDAMMGAFDRPRRPRTSFDAMRKIKAEGGPTDALGGSGGGGGSGSYGAPSLRYGRGVDGGYRVPPHRTGTVRGGTEPSHPSGTVRGGTNLGRGALPSDMPSTHLGRTGAKFAGKSPALMRGLMDRYGLTQEQAAGIVGNLGHESAEFTAYHEGGKAPGSGGVGWAQWTGSRRRDFERWTSAHNLDPTSDEASWRYLTEGDPQTARAIAAVKRTHTRAEAVRAFHDTFEISADTDRRTGAILKPKNWNHRLGLADKAFALGPAPQAATTYANEDRHGFGSQREAERAVLPRRSAPPETPERHAGGVDFDTSGIERGIHHLRTFKAELADLRGAASLDINHKHRHEGDIGGKSRPGALRTALNGGYASDGRSWT